VENTGFRTKRQTGAVEARCSSSLQLQIVGTSWRAGGGPKRQLFSAYSSSLRPWARRGGGPIIMMTLPAKIFSFV